MNWTGVPQRLMQLADLTELDDTDRAAVRDIEAMLASEQVDDPLSGVPLEVALQLAELRQKPLGLGDPAPLLARIRTAVEAGRGTQSIRERLARAYLICDLPWITVVLLDGCNEPLSDTAIRTLTQARLALYLIADDARHAAGSLYGCAGAMGDRLLDLLGIPPYVLGYDELNQEHTTRKQWDETPTPPGENRPTRLLPLFLSAVCEPVGPELAPKSQVATAKTLTDSDRRRLKEILDRLVNSGAVDVGKLTSRDNSFLTRCAFIDAPEASYSYPISSYQLHRALPIKNGAVLLFHIRDGEWTRLTRAAIVITSGHLLQLYSIDGDDGTEAFLRLIVVDPSAPAHVALLSSVGSSSVLTITAFDPSTRNIWTVADHLPKGVFSLLDMGPDTPAMLVISFSTESRRYLHFNQAPSRRRAVLIRYDRATSRYLAVATRDGGTDEYAATNQNLGGLNPEMFHRGDFNDVLARLADRSEVYISSGLKQDVGRLLVEVPRRYFPDRNFAEGARIFGEAVRILAAGSRDGTNLEACGHLLLHLVETHTYAMEIDRAAELIGDPLLVEAAAKYPEIATICTSISANLRLLTGDFGRSFEALEAWRTYAGDNNPFLEGSLAWFLADVGDDAGSHAAGLRALDLAISTKEAEARNIAIDMIHLARAALRLGRGLEAIDWLSRVLRLTRTQRSPELTGMALRAAADLALNHGLTRIAILLLDQAIISSGETVWQTDGTSTLLLYGLTLEQIPDIPVADDIFTMAVALSRRQRGAIMIAALSRRAFIADKRGANEDALCLAEEAFRAVLDGRSRIGQETYKLTFIGTSRAVAEQFLGLIVREGRDPGVVFDAIEDWRLPDYRSAEAVWGKFAVDSPLYSVGPFGS